MYCLAVSSIFHIGGIQSAYRIRMLVEIDKGPILSGLLRLWSPRSIGYSFGTEGTISRTGKSVGRGSVVDKRRLDTHACLNLRMARYAERVNE